MTYSISNEKYNVYPSGKRLKTEIWDAVEKPVVYQTACIFYRCILLYEIHGCLNICLYKLKHALKYPGALDS